MQTLLDRVKSKVKGPSTASPERDARLEAAAELREVVSALEVEVDRVGAINCRVSELSATLARLEKEHEEAQQHKISVLVSYASGDATEATVTAAKARIRDVAAQLSDTREMYEAVSGELHRCESDWPPPKIKILRDRKERAARGFWMAVFADIAATEAPAEVQVWIRRCWATYCIAGGGGLQGMFTQLFPEEFSLQEMEELRRAMEPEFLSE
ncbi:MAG: hypothetical protein HZC50_09645 [Nitrospirae bacterium]|nr:hypothetical protein [Nitrospirota bacterium]